MPRRIPAEAAVSSSPLFILSPEIRNMIYALLLTTSKQISFEEHSARALPFLRRKNSEDCVKDLFPSILLTCRLIYQEACPLLHRGNAFYFYEPATSDSFRWHTGSKHAAWVEEIGTTMSANLLPSYYNGDEERWLKYMKQKTQHSYSNFPRWFDYLIKRNFSLKDNYPHLKRLTITLGEGMLTARTEDLRPICELIGRNIRGLQSVHIVGLNDENMVSALTPMIERARTSPGDRRSVQTHTTELQTRAGWKNMTIWWGPESGNPPYHTTTSETDLQWRHRLFRIGDGPNFTYSVGSSFVRKGPR